MTKFKSDYCEISGVGPTMAFNRPKSLHKTKRVVKPNLQKWNGLIISNRVRRTLAKKAK